MKEIQIKAGVSRVQYLLLYKAKLKKEFAGIVMFMKKAEKELSDKAV